MCGDKKWVNERKEREKARRGKGTALKCFERVQLQTNKPKFREGRKAMQMFDKLWLKTIVKFKEQIIEKFNQKITTRNKQETKN